MVKKMKLNEITSLIEGDFVLVKRGFGRVKDKDGSTHVFNTELLDEGKDELPRRWLNNRVKVKSLTWSELLVEVLDND